jgi:hypothetical protein
LAQGASINIFPEVKKAPLVLPMNINGYVINPKNYWYEVVFLLGSVLEHLGVSEAREHSNFVLHAVFLLPTLRHGAVGSWLTPPGSNSAASYATRTLTADLTPSLLPGQPTSLKPLLSSRELGKKWGRGWRWRRTRGRRIEC